MRSTFSQRGWHVHSPKSQETADDEGLVLGLENKVDWATLHQDWGEEICCSTYQQPDAQGEKSPLVRRRMKLHYVLQIHAIKIYQSKSTVLNLVLWNVPQEVSDAKSMIWMQYSLIPVMVKVWHACSFPTAHLQQQYETIPGPKYPQSQTRNKNFKRSVLTEEEESSRHKTHANTVLITTDVNRDARIKKVVCKQNMYVQLTKPTTKHHSSREVEKLSGAKHMSDWREKTCMPHVSQPWNSSHTYYVAHKNISC